jgi:DNA-binding response OmpR family regulator
MKILIAEDDPHILDGLVEVFEGEGYDVLKARDGRQALALFLSQQPDFACLDIMMPGVNGYDVCRQIRKRSSTIPVIFITAKTEEVDKVLGLELGADDYIVKPFSVREVVARVRAVTRRTLAARAAASCDSAMSFRMGDLVVLPDELRARRGNHFLDLSLRDVKILHVLHQNAGKVVSRQALFCAAWGMDHLPNSRTLDQHISQLRKRIEEDPAHPVLIQTVHGVGYRYEAKES